MRPLLLLLGLAGVLCACGAETEVPEAPEPVTPEAVERYRTGAVVEMQAIDSAIAALETASAGADSAGAVAYRRTLDALFQERQAIQTGLDTLQALTVPEFEAATAALDTRIAAFEDRIATTGIELARDAGQLRQETARRLAPFDAALADLQATADVAVLADLQQRRERIDTDLASLGNPEVRFDSVRSAVAQNVVALYDRLDAVQAAPTPRPAPDSAAVGG